MLFRHLLLCCLFAAVLPGQDLDLLPPPAPLTRVVDATGQLGQDAFQGCATICAGIAASGRGQLIVLVVADCAGSNPREAGMRLFNRWGIGDRTRNDGVLLLVTLAERRAEFLLGSGIDDAANVVRSQLIIDRDMLPRFRSGDVPGAVAAGTEAAARDLFPAATVPVATAPARIAIEAPDATPQPPPGSKPTPVQGGNGLLGWLLGGTAAVGGGIGALLWKSRRPRTCPQCRIAMTRLDEVADDAQLTPAQRAEEAVGSVDYAVWACQSCPHVEVVRHGAWFSRYHACPACGARTASDRATRLSSPSELSTGLERIDTSCSHCGHHETRHRTLPRIQPASRTSGNRSSGGGGRTAGRGGGGGW
jgi:uncharacterized protein